MAAMRPLQINQKILEIFVKTLDKHRMKSYNIINEREVIKNAES